MSIQLEKNKVYHITFGTDPFGWLVRFSKMDGRDRVLYYSCMDYNSLHISESGERGWGTLGDAPIRPATDEEIYWLTEAERAGKYIPKPEIPQIYSIY